MLAARVKMIAVLVLSHAVESSTCVTQTWLHCIVELSCAHASVIHRACWMLQGMNVYDTIRTHMYDSLPACHAHRRSFHIKEGRTTGACVCVSFSGSQNVVRIQVYSNKTVVLPVSTRQEFSRTQSWFVHREKTRTNLGKRRPVHSIIFSF